MEIFQAETGMGDNSWALAAMIQAKDT